MKYTRSYKDSLSPNFDAVEDIKEYLGADKFTKLGQEGMSQVFNCAQFALYASLAGIEGFPVIAWYEHYHGQGSWKQEEFDVAFGKKE